MFALNRGPCVRSMHVSCVAVRGRDGDCRRTAAHTHVMQHARPTRQGPDTQETQRTDTLGGNATDCNSNRR